MVPLSIERHTYLACDGTLREHLFHKDDVCVVCARVTRLASTSGWTVSITHGIGRVPVPVGDRA